MPNAVVHILTPVILLNIYRDYITKKKFKLLYVLLAGLGGILPDIDIVVYWLLNTLFGTPLSEVHRTISHTLLMPLLMIAAGAILYRHHKPVALGIFAIAFGYSTHLLLDYLLTGSLPILYPLSTAKYGLNLIPSTEIGSTILVGIDAILLTTWLAYDFYRNNIKDFI